MPAPGSGSWLLGTPWRSIVPSFLRSKKKPIDALSMRELNAILDGRDDEDAPSQGDAEQEQALAELHAARVNAEAELEAAERRLEVMATQFGEYVAEKEAELREIAARLREASAALEGEGAGDKGDGGEGGMADASGASADASASSSCVSLPRASLRAFASSVGEIVGALDVAAADAGSTSRQLLEEAARAAAKARGGAAASGPAASGGSAQGKRAREEEEEGEGEGGGAEEVSARRPAADHEMGEGADGGDGGAEEGVAASAASGAQAAGVGASARAPAASSAGPPSSRVGPGVGAVAGRGRASSSSLPLAPWRERARWIPMRLSVEERRLLRLLEAALSVSDYAGHVDVLSWRSKASRAHAQIRDVCAILCGLAVAQDFRRGSRLLADREFAELGPFFARAFEVGRRYKIMNPERMRDTYGALMCILMDAAEPELRELLEFDAVAPLRTVAVHLAELGASALLDDPRLDLATAEIPPPRPGEPRSAVQRRIRAKEAAREALARDHASPRAPREAILDAIYSLADHASYLAFARQPVERVAAELRARFALPTGCAGDVGAVGLEALADVLGEAAAGAGTGAGGAGTGAGGPGTGAGGAGTGAAGAGTGAGGAGTGAGANGATLVLRQGAEHARRADGAAERGEDDGEAGGEPRGPGGEPRGPGVGVGSASASPGRAPLPPPAAAHPRLPHTPSARLSLAISGGSGGARLTHSHRRQLAYVSQSLALWSEVAGDMFRLWALADADLLDPSNPYRLQNTGQGLHRVQAAPRVGAAMRQLLGRCQARVGGWVGSAVVHLGDHNVPNALAFIDKYAQIPRFLLPVVRVLDALPTLAGEAPPPRRAPTRAAAQAQRDVAEYVRRAFGGADAAREEILADFFRHAFDGSGADNFFDAGSCVDGRLTSAWNWCSKLDEKNYVHLFRLAGFDGFDGEFK